MADGQAVESVWMKYLHGHSVCISSQAGCRLGCKFCASTIGGLKRSLSVSEMLGQVYAIQRLTGERVDNIVLKGVGRSDDFKIASRNTGKGNPNAINHFDVDLNNRQQKLLTQLSKYDSKVIVSKGDVSLKDLSALTAKTGDEFAMFTRGSQRMIVRGNAYSVNITGDIAQDLLAQGYKKRPHSPRKWVQCYNCI